MLLVTRTTGIKEQKTSFFLTYSENLVAEVYLEVNARFPQAKMVGKEHSSQSE